MPSSSGADADSDAALVVVADRGRLAEQWRARLAALLHQSAAHDQLAVEAALQLSGQIELRLQRDLMPDGHTYGVFELPGAGTGEPAGRIVLRDVETLNGRPPLQTTVSFGEAICLVDRRLNDPVAAHPSASVT